MLGNTSTSVCPSSTASAHRAAEEAMLEPEPAAKTEPTEVATTDLGPPGWKSRKTRSSAGGSTGTSPRNQFDLRCSALAALAPNRGERTRTCNPRLGGLCGLIAPRR